MLFSAIPQKFPVPFANSAGGGNITYPMPTSAQPGGKASLVTGFTTVNSTPIGAGGIPPFGADFNGILFQSTAWLQWAQAGGAIQYDATFSAEIGGYPRLAILLNAAGTGWWISTVDNNTSDPDTGGANWATLASGLIGVQVFSTPGTATYTPTPGTTSVIVEVQGGGAGGAGATAPTGGPGYGSYGAGGGSGGYSKGRFTSSFSGVTVTVGAGGAGGSGTVGPYSGLNGGTSSFGALITAYGGYGGTSGQNFTGIYLGGYGPGAPVGSGGNISNGPGTQGGTSFGSGYTGLSGPGGNTIYGGGGTSIVTSTAAGINATAYGAGGSGALAINTLGLSSESGGSGAGGVVIVWEYN